MHNEYDTVMNNMYIICTLFENFLHITIIAI